MRWPWSKPKLKAETLLKMYIVARQLRVLKHVLEHLLALLVPKLCLSKEAKLAKADLGAEA